MAEQDDQLLQACRDVLRHAYAPYSKFLVGAALRAGDGRIFTGINVENSSYGLTMCAERVALGKAISEGVRSFSRIAITSAAGRPLTPCGACRQVMAEFAPDLPILVLEGSGKVHELNLRDLLPSAFSGADLVG